MQSSIKRATHYLKAIFAIIYFGYPARNLQVIGVTGTDGKTTTATLIYQILKTAGKKVGLISTVAAYIKDKEIDTGLHVTSPDPWELQKLIKRMVRQNCEYLVLEATSHGLDQYRLMGTNVKIAVLTNITHEHLDYHKTFENYLKAKSLLFKKAKIAILNKSDKSFEKITKLISSDVKIVPYDAKSITGKLKEEILRKFKEPYNVLNATAAILTARQLDIEDDAIAKAFKNFGGIPGRMQEIENDRGIRVIVDFAHTPNALENVLTILKSQKKTGRLITVFGCAGERDKGKRQMMGEISAKLADISVFTAEDPRHEDVDEIIEEMEIGAKKNKKPNKFVKIPDRAEAIDYAINKLAKSGDIVVLCGKGHEKSLAYGSREFPWSDEKAAMKALDNEKKN